jgi:general secretion pathway protein C
VRLNQAIGRGSAIIETPDGLQSSFATGDEIMPGVTLKSVTFDGAIISRNGVDEQIFLDQSVGAQIVNLTPSSGNQPVQAAPPPVATQSAAPPAPAPPPASVPSTPAPLSDATSGLTPRMTKGLRPYGVPRSRDTEAPLSVQAQAEAQFALNVGRYRVMQPVRLLEDNT